MRVTLAGDNSGLGGALNYLNPLTDRLNKAIEEGSVQLMLNSTVTELVVKDGKCTGVKVGEVEYSAPTTLLATGGYCHNEELLKMAGFDNIVSQAPKTSNGSGFYLAQAVGGVFDNMDKLATYYGGGLMTDGFEMTYGANTNYPGRIYVDLNGNRVGDETTNDVHLWMNAPEDKLYLLSHEEILHYFPEQSSRMAYATEHAKAQGCTIGETTGACRWWLRTTGARKMDMWGVRVDGRLTAYGMQDVDWPTNTVRPVFWMDYSK